MEAPPTTIPERSVRPHLVDRTRCSLVEAISLIQHHGNGNPQTRVVFREPHRTDHPNGNSFSISIPVVFNPSRSSDTAQTQSASNQASDSTPHTLSVLADTSLPPWPILGIRYLLGTESGPKTPQNLTVDPRPSLQIGIELALHWAEGLSAARFAASTLSATTTSASRS